MRAATYRAISIIEVLAIIACVVLLLVIYVLVQPRKGRASREVVDATLLRGIHQSWLVYSREFNGVFPTPGLIKRLPFNGMDMPGRGEEDISQNTTANLFAASIMVNAFNADMCISPSEPSDKVKLSGARRDDYNYEAYDPTLGRYWDDNFAADLHVRSNVSYAHMPLFGDRKEKQWRGTFAASVPILGNRGPLGGAADASSITNKIHKPYSSWSGNIVFPDNHVSFVTAFPTKPRVDGDSYIIAPECLPKGKAVPSTDAAITFTKGMTADGPVVQHD